MRKEFKIVDDPWENFLAHDAKHFLPLINHKDPKTLSDQILIFKFIKNSIATERISEYKDKPDILAEKFLEFVRTFTEFENEQTLDAILIEMLNTKEIKLD